ncbi:MAG: hypothetical protein LKG27_02400 [Clostridiaceae bacterium]|jgi:hypothetical protein|nr:hypothetical protein [Clostridiaceae bacterium]
MNEIIQDLQECYKISIKEDYLKVQEPLLNLIVKLKNTSEIMQKNTYKDNKDRTKFNILLKLKNKTIERLPKARVPEEALSYLLENNLLKEEHFKHLLKNNFRNSFASKTGDLIYEYEQNDSVKRYTEININNKKYFVCNQWDKPAIDLFNEYINNEFAEYIQITERKGISCSIM